MTRLILRNCLERPSLLELRCAALRDELHWVVDDLRGVVVLIRMEQEECSVSRLVIVSNRLPVNIKREDDGSWSSKMSSGGLVAALSGLKMKSFLWIGWVGCEVAPEDRPEVEKLLLEVSSVLKLHPFLHSRRRIHASQYIYPRR